MLASLRTHQVKELGRGCFGSVWLARWRGVEVALKELHTVTDTQQQEVRVGHSCDAHASMRALCMCALCMHAVSCMLMRTLLLPHALGVPMPRRELALPGRRAGQDASCAVWLRSTFGICVDGTHLVSWHLMQVFYEAERLAALRHPCILSFYGACSLRCCMSSAAPSWALPSYPGVLFVHAQPHNMATSPFPPCPPMQAS